MCVYVYIYTHARIYTYIYTYTISPSLGSHTGDSTNSCLKIFRKKKFPESFKKQLEFTAHWRLFTLHLCCIRCYKYSRHALQYTGWCALGTCKYYAFVYGTPSIPRFCYPHGSTGTNPPCMSRDYYTYKGAPCFEKFAVYHIAFMKDLHSYLFS